MEECILLEIKIAEIIKQNEEAMKKNAEVMERILKG